MLFINNLGAGEIVVIFMVALLVFGPQKLPELGRSLGKGIRECRKGTSGLMDSLKEPNDQPVAPTRPTIQTPSQTAQTVPKAEPEKKTEQMVIDLEQEGKSN